MGTLERPELGFESWFMERHIKCLPGRWAALLSSGGQIISLLNKLTELPVPQKELWSPNKIKAAAVRGPLKTVPFLTTLTLFCLWNCCLQSVASHLAQVEAILRACKALDKPWAGDSSLPGGGGGAKLLFPLRSSPWGTAVWEEEEDALTLEEEGARGRRPGGWE